MTNLQGKDVRSQHEAPEDDSISQADYKLLRLRTIINWLNSPSIQEAFNTVSKKTLKSFGALASVVVIGFFSFYLVSFFRSQAQTINDLQQIVQEIADGKQETSSAEADTPDGKEEIQELFPDANDLVLLCLDEDLGPHPKSDENTLAWTDTPKEARDLAEEYAREFALCVASVYEDPDDDNFEFLLIDRLAEAEAVLYTATEVDIKENENGDFTGQEFERIVSYAFIKQHKDFNYIQDHIEATCFINDQLLIEISERTITRMPGAVIAGSGIFYEIECTSRRNSDLVELIADTAKKSITTLGTAADSDQR